MQQFNEYYRRIWGDRWDNSLLPALMKPTRHSCLINKFCDPDIVVDALLSEGKERDTVTQLPFISIPCFCRSILSNDCSLPFVTPKMDFANLKTYYLLDAASVLATEALSIQKDERVLDLCAAPGGKSIALAQRLFDSAGSNGFLVCNEPNTERRKRLHGVLKTHLPEKILKHNVCLTHFDGAQFGKLYDGGGALFDKILIDAPCSSERHLLHDTDAMSQWTENRSKQLSQKQLNILREAIRLLKPGGLLLYATCSISDLENDLVVEKACKKLKADSIDVRILSKQWKKLLETRNVRRWKIGEPTELGWIVLPDSSSTNDCKSGWGPLYFSLLQRQD